MNDKDKEAFDYFWDYKCGVSSEDCGKDDIRIVWQEACEYKRDEYSNLMKAMTQTSQNNFKLQAENNILSGEVLTYKKMSDDAFKKLAVAIEALDYYANLTLHELASTAREALKELEDK